MLLEVLFQEEVEWDDSQQVKEEPGFHVVERNCMDVRLHCVVLLVYVLLAEAEEDVEKKEDLHRIVEHDLLDIGGSAKGSIVRIDSDCVSC